MPATKKSLTWLVSTALLAKGLCVWRTRYVVRPVENVIKINVAWSRSGISFFNPKCEITQCWNALIISREIGNHCTWIACVSVLFSDPSRVTESPNNICLVNSRISESNSNFWLGFNYIFTAGAKPYNVNDIFYGWSPILETYFYT